MSEFEKIVQISPAYEKLHSDPKKNYGIGACRMFFILKGPKGAVQFQIGTHWHVPSAREHLHKFGNFQKVLDAPISGWDVGYHSPKPMFEEQPSRKCDVLGGECYYDGSSLRADDWLEPFIAGGTDWLWKHLEGEYRHMFEDGPAVQP